MHWHNVDSELTSSQKTRANAYIEHHVSEPEATNRIESASILNSCHCWALGFDEHIVGPDNETVLEDDYTDVNEVDVDEGELCLHVDNHTSVVSEVNDCTVIKVKSKWGWYGVYETGPSIYKGVDKYYEEQE